MTGNPIADQAEKDFHKQGLCPVCKKAYVQPEYLCEHDEQLELCESPLCGDVPGDCTFYVDGFMCHRCGHKGRNK